MHSFIFVTLCAASLVNGMVIPRQNGAPDPGDATNPTDPGVQAVPASAKPDNTFSNGAAEIIGGFPYDSGTIPDLYQPREIDIPFGRQFHGSLMMFPEGQLNQPGFNTDEYTPNLYDFANQSACGIPDNSYVQMKVAIHPYFLKYAGLDRELLLRCLCRLLPIAFQPSLVLVLTIAYFVLRILYARRLRLILARRRIYQ